MLIKNVMFISVGIMNMRKVILYQRFDLDLEKTLSVSEEPKVRKKQGRFRRVVIRKLTQKGYHYMESNAMVLGLPSSILLGLNSSHLSREQSGGKSDFYEIANRFKVSYKSGPFYTPTSDSVEPNNVRVSASSRKR